MSLPDLLGQMDARPGVRGRQFARLCAWYLSNAPEYRDRIRKVWMWSDWPGAWAADAGIDLVADVRDGGLWAIQAKAYDPSYWIRKADVDSFRSESGRPHFSFRLLIATTDHLGPTARRTLEPSASPSPTCCARSLNSPKLPGRPRWTTCGPGCLHAPSGTAGGVRDLPVLTTDRCRRSNGRSTPAKSAAVKMGAGAAVAAPNGAVIGDAIGRAFRAEASGRRLCDE